MNREPKLKLKPAVRLDPGFVIRPLGPADAEEYQTLRLAGMVESPEAFGSTYEEDAQLSLATVAQRLVVGSSGAERIVLGAYQPLEDSAPGLVGIAGCIREVKLKSRHTANVWGMYVATGARCRGIGRALLHKMIAVARGWPGVERLSLSVVAGDSAAQALYRALGFVSYGIEPDAYRQLGQSYSREYMGLRLR